MREKEGVGGNGREGKERDRGKMRGRAKEWGPKRVGLDSQE